MMPDAYVARFVELELRSAMSLYNYKVLGKESITGVLYRTLQEGCLDREGQWFLEGTRVHCAWNCKFMLLSEEMLLARKFECRVNLLSLPAVQVIMIRLNIEP